MPESLDLERLYEEHAQALFAFLLNLTRNEEDTRDLLQELFIKLAKRPELLRHVREPRAYLLRLAHHAAIDMIRRRTTREKSAIQLAADAQPFASSDDPDTQFFRETLAEALMALPEEQRAVVHLKLWEDLTFEQIADLLGLSVNTAASRYRYALDKLRAALRPVYENNEKR
jgi:RNA polymerase sigma-70 factor (ECF subfamily)